MVFCVADGRSMSGFLARLMSQLCRDWHEVSRRGSGAADARGLAQLLAQSFLICPICAASIQSEMASGKGQRRRVDTLMAICLIRPWATSWSLQKN